MSDDGLKQKTARTLKWNTIDKFATQFLYAVTGVILANILSKSDYGLVGVMAVFQAFATLFVDSGFSAALIQKKAPTERDYCTVFHFNLWSSVAIYIILWFCAPLIASTFGDERLVAMSRVMFLSFIINATALVQTNRLMKQMTVARIAAANSLGLVVSGVTGIVLAFGGYGAWAIVWQTIVLSAVKSAFLWITTRWVPRYGFSLKSLKSVLSVGVSVMSSSFLNTVSQNIYSFIIGKYYNLAQLGVYTQADKWSKMGVMSVTQILTNSFLPVLSGLQNERERFLRMARKMNRFSGYLLFPVMLVLVSAAEPLFHILFGTKWDEAILLFQILIIRGIFVVLTSLYNQYILALGKGRALIWYETVKDVIMIGLIFITLPFGVEVIVWGQLLAAVLFYIFALFFTAHHTGYRVLYLLGDILPYCAIATTLCAGAVMLADTFNPWVAIMLQFAGFAAAYILINKLLGSKVQSEVITFIKTKKI